MTLDEYLTVVSASRPSDWSRANAPTFLYRVVPVRTQGGGADLALQEHTVTMTYRHDIRVGMAWGLVADRNFTARWLDKLQSQKAEGVILDFLFAGAPVFRDTLIAVDNWRCILPQPLNDDVAPYKVPERRAMIARLVHELVGPETSFGSYFNRVGMVLNKTAWP